MEEADLLCDNVAIFRKGELAAFGTPLQLKTEYGSALQFSILVEKKDLDCANMEIKNFFRDSKKWVEVESSDAGNILIKILALDEDNGGRGVPVQTLIEFVKWLDLETSPVREFGITNSSLEEGKKIVLRRTSNL